MLRAFLIAAAFIVLVPAAARAQTMDHSMHDMLPADSLVGTWSYAIETPDGSFTGKLIVVKGEDGTLSARFTSDMGGDGGLPVRGFAFDGHKMTGTFTNPSYGDIGLNLTVTGRTFSGEFIALAMGAGVPASGRKL